MSILDLIDAQASMDERSVFPDLNESEYRIVGIDPGTTTLGISCLGFCLESGYFNLISSKTLNASKEPGRRPMLAQYQGDLYARLRALEDMLVEAFEALKPDAVVVETPFYNPRRPGAFAPLVSIFLTIQNALVRYNPMLSVLKVDPAKSKARLGVSGSSSDKSLVRDALARHLKDADPEGRIMQLDEHSSDSLAAAYYHATNLLANMNLRFRSPEPDPSLKSKKKSKKKK